MSTALHDQIRHFAARVEASQEAVTVEEARSMADRADTEPWVEPAHPRVRARRGFRPWPALVAALVVLVLFGAVALMMPGAETAPPADSPPSPEGDVRWYATSAIPEGFVVQDVRMLQSSVIYMTHPEGTWTPGDGAFMIDSASVDPMSMPEDLDVFLDAVVSAVPGSSRVDVGGDAGVIFESEIAFDGDSVPLVSILSTDGRGDYFEVSAVGMGRDEVLAVAAGVEPISLEEQLDMALDVDWDIQFTEISQASTYEVPALIDELSTGYRLAHGLDVLYSRLANATNGETVITSDSGELVDLEGEPIGPSMMNVFIEAPADGVEAILLEYPHSELSLEQHEARVDWYIDRVAGQTLSEDPHVIQAMVGPEPSFDVEGLGEELPLVPADDPEVVPDDLDGMGAGGDVVLATTDRPVILLGSAAEPGAERSEVLLLIWFTNEGVTCTGASDATGMGVFCGFEILSRFGVEGRSSEETDEGVFGDITYAVPLETSVVQIVTPGQDYWQRPIGGYGVVPYGNTVEVATEIIAYDSEGNEIGSWGMDLR